LSIQFARDVIGVQFGSAPALWADAVTLGASGSKNGVHRTNHFAATEQPLGGNVSHVDGHVAWYPYDPANNNRDAGPNVYQIGTNPMGSEVAFPSSSLFPKTRTDGMLDTRSSRDRWIRGANSMPY
jgi:prepilin-type processing-associated H-X9-DG protein